MKRGKESVPRYGCMNPSGVGEMKFINVTNAQLNTEVSENFMTPSLNKPGGRAFPQRIMARDILLMQQNKF